MKDCKKIHPLLTLYAEDALSPKEKAAVEKHLSGCPVARAEMEDWALMRKKVRDLPEPKPPQDLHERIMARVQGRAPAPSHSGFSPYALGPLAAAACVALYLYWKNPGWLEKPKPIASMAQPTQVTAIKTAASLYYGSEKGSATKKFNAEAGYNNALQNKQLAMTPKKKARVQAKDGTDLGLQGAASTNATYGTTVDYAANIKPSENQVVLGVPQPAAPAVQPYGGNGAPVVTPPPAPTPTAGIPAAALADQTMLYSKEITGQNWSGPLGPVTVESQLLITDAVTFQTQWNLFQPNQPLPTVDFTAQAVVLLTAGNEPATGYSIAVSKLEEQAAQLVVHYQVTAPAAGAVTGQMVTRPWSMQAIPKPAKPVVFLKD